MKRKHSTRSGVEGHSESKSKQRRFASQPKDIPLTSVFTRLLNDVSKTSNAPKSQGYSKGMKNRGDLFYILCTFANNLDGSFNSHIYICYLLTAIKTPNTGSFPSQLTLERKNRPIAKINSSNYKDMTRDSGTYKNQRLEQHPSDDFQQNKGIFDITR